MMQELLTKGIGPDGKPHTQFKDSPVGRIPVGWEVVKVTDIQASGKYTCVGGPFDSNLTSKDYVNEPGITVIRGTNIPLDTKQFDTSDFVYVSEAKADTLVQNMAYPGDLVFTQRGTLGQVGLVPTNGEHKKYIVSQSQMKLTVDHSIANVDFYYQYFTSPRFLKQLDLETIGTGVPHINLSILRNFKLPKPSVDEQHSIVSALESFDTNMSLKLNSLQTVKNLKKALMQDLLTGKARVTPDPE